MTTPSEQYYQPGILPPYGKVKLIALRPHGLPKFGPPMMEWIDEESQMLELWFRRDGLSDVDAVQLLHADGMISTVFREQCLAATGDQNDD